MKKLQAYKTKRTLSDTPEPKPKIKSSQKNLIFVIQKHQATRLHYDLRLEVNGVLKSWAVPKGPSTNPSDKRLAVMVEDHPYDYHTFEGNIPVGNYGAGAVMVWDEGIYTIPGAETVREAEKLANEGLEKGHLTIVFFGKKMKGEYALIRTNLSGDQKNWLLVKAKDSYASSKDITKENRSVKTDRTIEEIGEKVKKKPLKSKSQKMPHHLSPMLSVMEKEPFDRKDWIFETKWDGYRAISEIENGEVQLYSRNKNSFNSHYPQIVSALTKLSVESAILDGELVLLDSKGKSQFQLMQNYLNTQKGKVIYYIFDLLYLNGFDLREFPLIERKKLLKQLLSKHKNALLKYSAHIEEKGIAYFKKAQKLDLEGIMAKDGQSPYRSKRSKEWVKIKTQKRQEVVIAGFTKPKGSRKHFGALLVGVYEGKKLIFSGKVGGGFTQKLLKEVYDQLVPLIQEKSPLENYPKSFKDITWVQPKLVCEVVFTEWTSEGYMRHPVFKGLRIDKNAKKVKREFYETN